jgi:hypothetical protein
VASLQEGSFLSIRYFQLKGISEVSLHQVMHPLIVFKSSACLCRLHAGIFRLLYSQRPLQVDRLHSAEQDLPIITINIIPSSPYTTSAHLIQPRPTPNNSPLCHFRQIRKHTQTQIQIRRRTPHTSIHNLDINTPISTDGRIVPRNPYHLPTQRIIIRIRARRRSIKDKMRDSADCFC